MKGMILEGPQDYLALVVRRRWWIAVPAVLISLLVAVVALQLPDIFVSETAILIEPRDVPADFVKDLVSLNAAQRLDAVKQKILSRTNLLRIVNQYQDQLAFSDRLNEEDKITRINDDILIESAIQPGKASIFRISYENSNPELAQNITARIGSLFIEYDNRTREEKVYGTTSFLQDELQKVTRNLEEVESRLTDQQQRYRYELPEQMDTNLRSLDRLYVQLQASTEALDRITGHRLDLERQISETGPVLEETVVGGIRTPAARGLPPLVMEYREKLRMLEALESRYTDMHPTVRQARAELEQMRSEIPPTDFIDTDPESEEPVWDRFTKPNPRYQNLISQLSEIKREVDIRQRDQEWIQGEINKYTERIQKTPQHAAEMSDILRTHGELNRQYEDLRNKLVQSKLAESLESKQKGEQFVILDAANFPLSPAKPNRLILVLAGMFASLGIGLAAAFSVDVLDQKFWTHTEVEQLLGVPVLVEIPHIVTEEVLALRKRSRRIRLSVLLVSLTVCLAAAYVVYSNPNVSAMASHYLGRAVDLIGSGAR